MKIRVLIVDNDKNDLVVRNMVDWVKKHFPGSPCEPVDQVEFDLALVMSHDPDVAIVDVALNDNDEEYCDALATATGTFDATRELSGIEYCRKLKANFSELPVILASKYLPPMIHAKAIESGADGFLYKCGLEEDRFIPALKTAFYRNKTNDVALYEKLRRLLEDDTRKTWHQKRMLYAMDAFFTRGSGTRRLTGLWCSLSGIIEDLLPSETVYGLLRAMVDTEALLLAANPRMRDHVRHAGNVFWLGYYILNSLPAFREPQNLPRHNPVAYEGSSLSPFEQLNLVWLLASLLHDIGYLRERIGKIDARMERGRTLFCATQKKTAKVGALPCPNGFDVLKEYLAKMEPEGSRLFSAIACTCRLWGKPAPEDDSKLVEDHGLAGASAFLGSLNPKAIERPEILHAATAIALHNLAKWNLYWPEEGGLVKLPVGLLPIAWLLGYCDETQGWGREPDSDPFDVDSVDDVIQARMQYGNAYVKGSRIDSFRIADSANCLFQARMELGIQYMMMQGDHGDAASDEVCKGVAAWRRDRVPVLRKTLDLDALLETTITHRIPSPVDEPIVVHLDKRADA